MPLLPPLAFKYSLFITHYTLLMSLFMVLSLAVVMDFLVSLHALRWDSSLFSVIGLDIMGSWSSFSYYSSFIALGCSCCTFSGLQCWGTTVPHHTQCKCKSWKEIPTFRWWPRLWDWGRTSFLCWWLEWNRQNSASFLSHWEWLKL